MDLTNKIYTDEDTARLHLENIRWPNGVSCPLCGGTDKCKPTPMRNKITKKNPEQKEVRGYYHCGDCLEKFTVRTGMVYERSHVPLNKWVLATHLLCASKKGMSAHQLHRMIGVTYKTAWFMAHRIREAMIETNPDPNHVENYFSVFKRGMKGVYQHCSEKHLGRYLVEFDFRYNRRDMTDFDRAVQAMKGAEGKRLMYNPTVTRKFAQI